MKGTTAEWQGAQLAHTFLHTRFGVNVVHGTIGVGHDESRERVIFGTGEFKHYAAGVDDQRVNLLDRTRFSRPRALPELLPVGPSLEGFGNRGYLLVPGPLCLGLPGGRRRTSCTPLRGRSPATDSAVRPSFGV